MTVGGWGSVSAGRRAGVSALAKSLQLRGDLLGQDSHVEKQSYFPRRRYADRPTRFPFAGGQFLTLRHHYYNG